MDSKLILSELKKLNGRMDKLEAGATGMDSALINTIAKRDALVEKLTPFIGTFDHKSMTATQVAEYGVKKLGITAPKGHEASIIEAHLHGRVPEHKQKLYGGTGMDGAPTENALGSAWEKQGEKA
jgi:hypothetical protein